MGPSHPTVAQRGHRAPLSRVSIVVDRKSRSILNHRSQTNKLTTRLAAGDISYPCVRSSALQFRRLLGNTRTYNRVVDVYQYNHIQYPKIAPPRSPKGLRRGVPRARGPWPGHVGVFEAALMSQRRPTRGGWDEGGRRPTLHRKKRGRVPLPGYWDSPTRIRHHNAMSFWCHAFLMPCTKGLWHFDAMNCKCHATILNGNKMPCCSAAARHHCCHILVSTLCPLLYNSNAQCHHYTE